MTEVKDSGFSLASLVPGRKPWASLTNSTWFALLVTYLAKASAKFGFLESFEMQMPWTKRGGTPMRFVIAT